MTTLKQKLRSGRRKLKAACFAELPPHVHPKLRTIFNRDHKSHYLSISEEDPKQVSYALGADKDSKYLTNKRRRCTLYRYLTRQYNNLGIDEYALQQHCTRILNKIVPPTIVLMHGEDVWRAYYDDEYAHSCMAGKMHTKFYAANPDKVGLLTVKTQHGNGRALAWHTSEFKYLDMIYTSSNQVIEIMENWARENGYSQRAPNGKFEIEMNKYETYPYMDTFMYAIFRNDKVYLSTTEDGMTHSFRSEYGRTSRFAYLCDHCGNTNATDRCSCRHERVIV
jgi:hypothetical protein